MMTRPSTVTWAALAFAAVLNTHPAYAQIGTVAAVNQIMEGTPPERAKRQLIIGDGLISNERVQTSPEGTGQLLFVDQTSLTVAADSDIILDKYIFDPDKKSGDIALSIARGSARFVGGLITKRSTATIRTPSSTIGIRGGMALIEVGAGETKVTNIASISISVETYGDADGDGFDDGPGPIAEGSGAARSQRQPKSRVVLTRTSSTATSDSTGTTFTGIANDQDLASAYGAFEGNGSGGLTNAPNSNTVNDGTLDIATNNSQADGGSKNAPVTTTGAQTTEDEAPEPVDPNAENQQENNLADAISDSLEDFVSAPIAQPGDDLDPTAPAFEPIPDPADIAVLSGTAVYNGLASGTIIDTKGLLAPIDITGTSELLYDFTQRVGVLQLDITPGTFTVEVAADAANAAQFSGNELIFGGPDSISAQGGFRSTPEDVAARVEGTFELDRQTQFQQISGTFSGDR